MKMVVFDGNRIEFRSSMNGCILVGWPNFLVVVWLVSGWAFACPRTQPGKTCKWAPEWAAGYYISRTPGRVRAESGRH